MADNPLGRETDYPDRYSPELLFPVPRADGRASLGLGDSLPFHGRDLWTAWELSWLDGRGRPVVAVLTLDVPAESPNLVESKSLKLYLNSFAMTRFDSPHDVAARLREDLGAAAGQAVSVDVCTAATSCHDVIGEFPGECIDDADVDCERYELDPGLLQTGDESVHETLHSHALRSLCPVTGQPDTGSVLIDYHGPRIDRGALLTYLASFRQHSDFHELCVERIFCDLKERCSAEALTVYARYNRRGGIDINPFRSNTQGEPPRTRLWRQ